MRGDWTKNPLRSGVIALAVAGLTAACVPATQTATAPRASTVAAAEQVKFEQDRQAILAMTGDYKVTFDFRETVSLHDGYELKEPKLSGGHEVVRVLEDTGTFISLQHTLLVGPESDVIVKHWRQDWVYEPTQIWEFVGRNAWETRKVPVSERKGKWAQLVYQVDDSPRYAAVAAWTHDAGGSAWTPPLSWRPLPRRDMTTRDDYDVVVAVNRHVITPGGWVHEQDNSKMVLADDPYYLVREIGVNTYLHSDGYDPAPAEAYWAATGAFWAAIRAEWAKIAKENKRFAWTVQGETEPVYLPILGNAQAIADGAQTTDEAVAEAIAHLHEYLEKEPKPVQAAEKATRKKGKKAMRQTRRVSY